MPPPYPMPPLPPLLTSPSFDAMQIAPQQQQQLGMLAHFLRALVGVPAHPPEHVAALALRLPVPAPVPTARAALPAPAIPGVCPWGARCAFRERCRNGTHPEELQPASELPAASSLAAASDRFGISEQPPPNWRSLMETAQAGEKAAREQSRRHYATLTDLARRSAVAEAALEGGGWGA